MNFALWILFVGVDKKIRNIYVAAVLKIGNYAMKIANSLKSLKKRDANCKVVRRKGRTYVINKKNPRYKARQG